jgi:hypothetical protein
VLVLLCTLLAGQVDNEGSVVSCRDQLRAVPVISQARLVDEDICDVGVSLQKSLSHQHFRHNLLVFIFFCLPFIHLSSASNICQLIASQSIIPARRLTSYAAYARPPTIPHSLL